MEVSQVIKTLCRSERSERGRGSTEMLAQLVSMAVTVKEIHELHAPACAAHRMGLLSMTQPI